MPTKSDQVCKDCTPFDSGRVPRPAPHPGPRCATHHREVRKARQKAAHNTMVQKVYGLGPAGYDALYEAQGGHCAGCQRATGRTKRLAVDHNHTTGAVRGLLCGPCNQIVGYLRDDPAAFRRLADYLESPPATRVL